VEKASEKLIDGDMAEAIKKRRLEEDPPHHVSCI
jgi:hypothetical protein